MNEFEIIERYFKPLSDEKHGLGLVDDAALIRPDPGHEFVMTTDTLVEDVHFIGAHNAGSLADKAIGVNVSDIIAKGAKPKYYLLTLSYSPGPNFQAFWFERFADALKGRQEYYGCLLIGGDSVRTSGPLTVSITMIGQVKNGEMVRRSTANTEDLVYVSNAIGDAVIGLELYRQDKGNGYLGLSIIESEYFLNRYDFPEPEPKLSALVRDYATAAMDISDGLLGDLEKLCRASGQGADIQLPKIPIDPSLKQQTLKDPDLLARMVTGGDDYEVLMSVAPSKAQAFEQAAKDKNVMVTQIGRITDGSSGFRYYDKSGKLVEFAQKSYAHY